MSYFFKIAAVGMIAAIWILLIRKQNADFALLLSIACMVLVLIGALTYLQPVVEYIHQLQNLCQLNTEVLAPLFKTIAVGIVCQIVTGVCADAGEQALAKTIELCRTIVALYVSLPLIKAVFSLFDSILQGG